MEKYKYLLKNVGLMTISNFGSKILSFLLVPLYTSVLSTSEYGTYDLYVITIFLLSPILSLNNCYWLTFERDEWISIFMVLGFCGCHFRNKVFVDDFCI